MRAERVPIIDSTCGVFMEMDENRLIAEGFSRDEIAAAITRGTAASYYYKFVGGAQHSGNKCSAQGGPALGKAFLAALAQVTEKEIEAYPHREMFGAWGQALDIIENIQQLQREGKPFGTAFRGWQIVDMAFQKRKVPCRELFGAKSCGVRDCQLEVFQHRGRRDHHRRLLPARQLRVRPEAQDQLRGPLPQDLRQAFPETGLPAERAGLRQNHGSHGRHQAEHGHAGQQGHLERRSLPEARFPPGGLAAERQGHRQDRRGQFADRVLHRPQARDRPCGPPEQPSRRSSTCSIPASSSRENPTRRTSNTASTRRAKAIFSTMFCRSTSTARSTRSCTSAICPCWSASCGGSSTGVGFAYTRRADAGRHRRRRTRPKSSSRPSSARRATSSSSGSSTRTCGPTSASARDYVMLDPEASSSSGAMFSQVRGLDYIPQQFLEHRFQDIPLGEFVANEFWTQSVRILQANLFVANHPNLFAIRMVNFACGPDSLKIYQEELIQQAVNKPLAGPADGRPDEQRPLRHADGGPRAGRQPEPARAPGYREAQDPRRQYAGKAHLAAALHGRRQPRRGRGPEVLRHRGPGPAHEHAARLRGRPQARLDGSLPPAQRRGGRRHRLFAGRDRAGRARLRREQLLGHAPDGERPVPVRQVRRGPAALHEAGRPGEGPRGGPVRREPITSISPCPAASAPPARSRCSSSCSRGSTPPTCWKTCYVASVRTPRTSPRSTPSSRPRLEILGRIIAGGGKTADLQHWGRADRRGVPSRPAPLPRALPAGPLYRRDLHAPARSVHGFRHSPAGGSEAGSRPRPGHRLAALRQQDESPQRQTRHEPGLAGARLRPHVVIRPQAGQHDPQRRVHGARGREARRAVPRGPRRPARPATPDGNHRNARTRPRDSTAPSKASRP